MSPADEGMFASLSRLCDGLLFPSETDAPIIPVFWPGLGRPDLTPAMLLMHERLPEGTSVETAAFDEFFASYDPAGADPTNPVQQATLMRIQALRDALASTLSELSVFRIGRIDIAIYVLGLTPDGAVAGVQTRAVET